MCCSLRGALSRENCDVLQVDVRSNGLNADTAKLFIPIVDKPYFESFSGIPIKQIRNNSIASVNLKGSDGKRLEACGGVILAHILTSNTSVTEVDVSNNWLGAKGGKALAAGLKDNTTISQVR